ncbi:MAG: hypothetical protein U1F33_09625 [Alphaproteobacteria bacterium]
MVRILRWFGWILLLGAIASVVSDAIASMASGRFALRPMGELWFSLSPSTLNLVQAVVQRYIDPDLWDNVIFPVLNWPTVAVLGIPGLALIALLRPRRRR